MIVLVLVVCSAQVPTVCQEERSPIDAASPMACLVQGESIVAGWLDEHPKWQLSSWRCQFGPREEGT